NGLCHPAEGFVQKKHNRIAITLRQSPGVDRQRQDFLDTVRSQNHATRVVVTGHTELNVICGTWVENARAGPNRVSDDTRDFCSREAGEALPKNARSNAC